MLGSIIIQRKKYGIGDFLAAGLMCLGLTLFTLADSMVSPNFNLTGEMNFHLRGRISTNFTLFYVICRGCDDILCLALWCSDRQCSRNVFEKVQGNKYRDGAVFICHWIYLLIFYIVIKWWAARKSCYLLSSKYLNVNNLSNDAYKIAFTPLTWTPHSLMQYKNDNWLQSIFSLIVSPRLKSFCPFFCGERSLVTERGQGGEFFKGKVYPHFFFIDRILSIRMDLRCCFLCPDTLESK